MENTEGESFSEKSLNSTSAQEIVDRIKTLEKELDSIQSSCPHQDLSIKNVPQGPENSFCLRKVCSLCQAAIGYPSQEEINEWSRS